MASVSSLDQDMKRIRLDRYTPGASDEVRKWIERTLGEHLQPGDLLDALRDGVALCKLANMALPPPGIRYKASSMPFTQMENISQFLTACERAPLNMPSHDRFLTVDLYDRKDPAQVLQCLGAFSRAANGINPSKFPAPIGPKRSSSPVKGERERGNSNVSTFSGNSPAAKPLGLRSPGSNVSSWSKKTDEGSTAPAWNIHQYGYMGGASQGNQGVSFGSRRQIVSPAVPVPSVEEKIHRRKEQEAEADLLREEAHEADARRKAQIEADEQRAKAEEDRQWAEATRREKEREQAALEEQRRADAQQEEESRQERERERQQIEAEKKRWEEQQRRWKDDEAMRRREWEVKAHVNRDEEVQAVEPPAKEIPNESDRIKELERQLEEARERERQYQIERGQREKQQSMEANDSTGITSNTTTAAPTKDAHIEDDSLVDDSFESTGAKPPRPLPNPGVSSTTARASPFRRPQPPLSSPAAEPQPALPPRASATPPQVDTAPYSNATAPPQSRTDRFLAQNNAPTQATPASHFPSEMGMTSESERAAEDARRAARQEKTKAGGWASKSLLEKEMERERERQKEWEEAQLAKQKQGTVGSGRVMGPRAMGSR